jgi:lipopolysaccharide transport system ATP-binding protein
MSLSAIEVSGLSKRYVIEHESRHDNLRDTLHHTARRLWRRFRWGTGFATEEFWALRDVSFSVAPGEVVGIVGRNGAGKSTLLKILSRITEPTSGSIKLRGRVASLLEVGTGFHPDLTGRENIFLNGAILGMHRAEIRHKFDEIVAFAEIERFLDTPVKRYSSGMYVRLAFAVAAHLEPEILIVDEVLAVGDVNFQRKCLGRIREISQNGDRTVLFVSHNLQQVRQLCTRALLLQSGSLEFAGPVGAALNRYHASLAQTDSAPSLRRAARISTVQFVGPDGQPIERLTRSDHIQFQIHLEVRDAVAAPLVAMAVLHGDQQPVFSEFTRLPRALSPGHHLIAGTFSAAALKPETYFFNCFLFDGEKELDRAGGHPLPEILDPAGDPLVEARRWGIVRVPVEWQTDLS